MHLHEVEIGEVLTKLPDIEEFDRDSGHLQIKDDLLLCALGFEQRCLSMIEALKLSGYRSVHSSYLRYSTNRTENSMNLSSLNNTLHSISESISPLDADEASFGNDLRAVIDSCIKSSDAIAPNVSLDVSSMANRALLTCLSILLEYDVYIQLLYSEAQEYYPSASEYNAHKMEWMGDETHALDEGVGKVLVSSTHPGSNIENLPELAVLTQGEILTF